MLTARGWWLLVVVALQLMLGVVVLPAWTVTPALVGLAVAAWVAYEWAAFRYRVQAAVRELRVRRELVQGGRPVPMVWAGLPFEVRVTVQHDGPAVVPFAVLEDRPPEAAELAGGSNRFAGGLWPGRPAELAYTLRCPGQGVLRFEGVAVRVTDLQGFFYHRLFLRDAAEFLVLPPLADDEGRQRADKQFNALPPPGRHRLRRPGSGSELLDLRDYQPGDPPKMIAWKASARRDRLVTKEFESDVPVRCVLFLDASESTRLGPAGRTPLARLAGVAAAVAQAAAANRDLVGLTTFDTSAAGVLAPARTKRHLIAVLRQVAETSALQPGVAGVPADVLVSRAYTLAREVYPDLTDPFVNAVPLGRLWRPLMDARWGWLVWVPVVLTPLLAVQGFWLRGAATFAGRFGVRTGLLVIDLLWLLLIFAVALLLPAVLAFTFWLLYGLSGWVNPRRTAVTRRKRVAALFALRDGGQPGAVERYVHDDEAFRERAGRFFQEHQVRVPAPLYDDAGRYRYRCQEKADVLAAAVARAVGRARDNELYVVLADLAELGPDLAPVVKAVRLARARRHQVLVVVPWPTDVPPPDAPPRPDPRTPVQDALARQYHHAFRDLRRELGRAGAVVVRSNDGDPVRLVLDRLDRLRGTRSRQ